MNNAPDRDETLELVAAYALGILPPSQHQAVAALLAHDAAARAEYEELRPAADLIGLSAEEPIDSARLARMKQRLMATIRPQPAAAMRRSSWFVGTGLAAAAAVVVALVSTVQNISLRGDLTTASQRVLTLQAQIAQNQRVEMRNHAMVADLIAADAQRFAVPHGDVVRHDKHLYLTLHALPPLTRGKVYQAWTLAKGAKNVTPSITFTTGPGGDAVVALPENADGIAAVALSVEPEGGSKAPTTPPDFVRPLS